jgi:hypothetical protein
VSRRTLSRQAAQKCVGKSMSLHRDLPRATLSSSTPLQSRQKALLRQHFAKFHHSHPERTTLYILNIQPRHHLPTNAVIANLVIQNAPSRHPKRSHHVILNLFQDLCPPTPSSIMLHPVIASVPITSSCTTRPVILNLIQDLGLR